MDNKILFITTSFGGGGAEKVVSLVSSYIYSLGHDVEVLLYYKDEEEYEHNLNMRIHYLVQTKKEYKSLSLFKKIHLLRTFLLSINPQFVIPFLPQVGFHTMMASKRLNFKLIQTIRNNPSVDPENFLLRLIRNYAVKKSRKTFVQCEEQKRYFSKKIQNKILVIPNPVSEKFISAVRKSKTKILNAISLGRLAEQKNFEMLIEASKSVVDYNPLFKLYIYGEGNLHDRLKECIEKFGLSNNVFLCGRTEDTLNALLKSDLFILSSNYEGLPNSLLEAMAVGLPCISTNCPTGPSSVIKNNFNGWLTPVNDKKEMASSIIKVMNKNELELENISVNAKEEIKKNYSFATVIHLYLHDLLEII